MKNRLARVNELIQRELGVIVQRDFEFIGSLVTINDVDITPDLKHCHVFIGVIGSEKSTHEIVEKLNQQHGNLQKKLMSRITLRSTPLLHFKLDDSVARGVRVTRLMETIDAEIGPDAWKTIVPEEGADVEKESEKP